MPLAFIAIGAVFLIAAVRGTISDKSNQPGLVTLLKGDFVGNSTSGGFTNTFLVWIVALYIVGALGYIPGFRPLANALLILVLLVMFLVNSRQSAGGGFFAEINNAIKGN